MKMLHRWRQSLVALTLASTAWVQSAQATETLVRNSTDYFQGADSIEIFVPPPERRQPGVCSALLQPAIGRIISPYERHWGILVETLDNGTVLYSHNADKFFIPASNIKLFTTAAALQKLSPQATVRSNKSLKEWVMITNLNSNNFYADTLLRHIGGSQSAKYALTQLGINPGGFRLADGSGLSRRNVATPRAIVATLRAMRFANAKDVFYASLPVAGISGTLKNRLRRTAAQGQVHAKTGTLKGVRALSGYMNHTNYGPLVFSILVNRPGYGRSLVTTIDKIVLQLNTIRPCQ